MKKEVERIVIVGAGQAGSALASVLREKGFDGDLDLYGDERGLPYQRPPLSKGYLKGSLGLGSLLLRNRSFYEERRIGVYNGLRAIAVDPAARAVSFEDGSFREYDVLVFATGSRARLPAISGIEFPGVHTLCTLDDADGLRRSIKAGGRAALVGGGYIGLEVAASLSALGCHVTVLEREARLLARIASPQLSEFFAVYHAGYGVDVLTQAHVQSFEAGRDGRVCAVRLADDTSLACDAALLCAGGEPNDELAAQAGLKCDQGIVVDIEGRTSSPGIFAIGDVTRRPLPLYGDRMHRIESVPNAIEQAKQAACAILGLPRPSPEVPWFWSDQFDAKLKIAGISIEPDEILLRGSPEAEKFSILHMKGGRLICLESVNATADFMAARMLIAGQQILQTSSLVDPGVELKTLAT